MGKRSAKSSSSMSSLAAGDILATTIDFDTGKVSWKNETKNKELEIDFPDLKSEGTEFLFTILFYTSGQKVELLGKDGKDKEEFSMAGRKVSKQNIVHSEEEVFKDCEDDINPIIYLRVNKPIKKEFKLDDMFWFETGDIEAEFEEDQSETEEEVTETGSYKWNRSHMATSGVVLTDDNKILNESQGNGYALALPALENGKLDSDLYSFRTEITSENVHNFFGFVKKEHYESNKSNLRWTQADTLFLYCSRSCVFVDGKEEFKHPSSKTIKSGIMVTTVNFQTGEVVFSREGD
jgi:hypothetical protein